LTIDLVESQVGSLRGSMGEVIGRDEGHPGVMARIG